MRHAHHCSSVKSLLTFFAIARHDWPRQRVFLATVSSLITSLACIISQCFAYVPFLRSLVPNLSGIDLATLQRSSLFHDDTSLN